MMSNTYLLPAYQATIDELVSTGLSRDILISIIGVKREYLDAAFDEVDKKYGSIEAYFEKG